MWEYYQHQIEISDKGYEVLKANGLVYLALEERCGKTGIALRISELSKAERILIITKKKALPGIEEHIKGLPITKTYHAINYESLHKLTRTDFDLIIIDEAHANLSAYPKVGKIWKAVYKLTKDKPIIYLSATPSAQTYGQLYHQLKLSSWTPFKKYKNFYEWHRVYGIEEFVYGAGGRQIKQYHNVLEKAFDDCKHLFISYTRQELGFEHEPNDVLHFVKLNDESRKLYNDLNKDQVLNDLDYIADTPMKLMVGLHQIEGGTLKCEDSSINLPNCEKIQYIKEKFGDIGEVVIFYHYKQEELKLKASFKHARILQATSFAEGVDLSMYRTLIVYSMDFSTARYTQRRARQCNMKRGEAIDVHYILVEDAISHQVYETVAINKKNFVNSYFNRGEL